MQHLIKFYSDILYYICNYISWAPPTHISSVMTVEADGFKKLVFFCSSTSLTYIEAMCENRSEMLRSSLSPRWFLFLHPQNS